jgi:hypothetical protein
MSRNYEQHPDLFPWIQHPPWRTRPDIPGRSSDAGPDSHERKPEPEPEYESEEEQKE